MSDTLMRPPCLDRQQGGRLLAAKLHSYQNKPQTLGLGLPRGVVVTAAAVAEELHLPLDVLVVRKLGTPGQSELAMRAIGPGGVRVLNDDVVKSLRITPEQIDRLASPEPFVAVGCWYDEFTQVEDEEVVQVLRRVERDAA